MPTTPQPADRIRDLIRQHNREVYSDVLLKIAVGFVFTLFVFGMVYWFGWFVGFLFGRWLSLEAWEFGLLFAGLFLVVAIWSAWRRVDPLAGMQRLTDKQLFLTIVSQASPHVLYFSPRHASAGLAVILLGGPANLFHALGLWTQRIRADETLIDEAARLLAACQGEHPTDKVCKPAAAVLLRRLDLMKVLPSGVSSAFTLTEKGRKALGTKGRGKASAGLSGTQ